MKEIRFFRTVLFVLISVLAISACEKQNDDQTEMPDDHLASSHAIAEAIFDEVSIISDHAFRLGSGETKAEADESPLLNNCATVTIDTTVIPHVMTIDFGEENCLCGDGKWRRGQIIVTFTGPYHQPGTVITHGFNNFFVNDNQVEGLRTMTNLGPNEDGHPEYETVVDGTITLNNNQGVIIWQADRLRTWIEGYTTPMWYDDVFLITGSGSHSHSNGSGFTRTILTPLRKELSCHHFVSGVVQTVPENKPVRTLDYGDGACDNIATLTIGNKTFIIQLP